ncbi:unnamed protein product [Orchesella dallaii]|uniref:Carbonic anhydrase n=1 Tax=Orchesella dallaii TaxID=48710 RepID=A0ABP1RJ38_9HEXA
MTYFSGFSVPFLLKLSLISISLQVPTSLQFPQENPIITDFDVSAQTRITRGDDHGSDVEWCYQNATCGETTWPSTCLTGKAQSPINFPPLEKTTCTIKNFPRTSYNSQKFSLESNGKSLVIKLLDKTKQQRIHFQWQEQNASYNFNSIHMHWGGNNSVGSEHSIDSKRFAIEMHLIHVRADFKTLPDALSFGKKNALAVLGILFEVDPNLKEKQNENLQPIVKNIHEITHSGVVKNLEEKLNLQAFMKGNHAYHYMGSLTTPSCNEAVAWLVWQKPIKISSLDLDALRTVKNTMGEPLMNNFRSTQKTNERKITLCEIKAGKVKDNVGNKPTQEELMAHSKL